MAISGETGSDLKLKIFVNKWNFKVVRNFIFTVERESAMHGILQKKGLMDLYTNKCRHHVCF